MTRFGIGPTFFIITFLTGTLVGLFTYLFPDWFMFTCLPFWLAATIGFVLLLPGIVAYAISLRDFNRGHRNEQLVVKGPYSVVRHPIYSAWIILIIPGTTLFFRSWLMLLIPLTAYISFKICIHKEDDYLRSKFGQAYLDYRSKTNELFPEWGFWKEDRDSGKER